MVPIGKESITLQEHTQ